VNERFRAPYRETPEDFRNRSLRDLRDVQNVVQVRVVDPAETGRRRDEKSAAPFRWCGVSIVRKDAIQDHA
jgi:hypothetical protein